MLRYRDNELQEHGDGAEHLPGDHLTELFRIGEGRWRAGCYRMKEEPSAKRNDQAQPPRQAASYIDYVFKG